MNTTILKYPGSKNRLADKIISLFTDNYREMTYIEPFFGSGAVFFNKAPSIIETINDIDGEVYNLFFQIRENSEELSRLIRFTPWSRQEYEKSFCRNKSKIENARRFLIRTYFAIGGINYCRTGWRHNIKSNNGNLENFENLPQIILETAYRLRPKRGNIVQIENRDAFSLIEKYNRENVLMYLDPPCISDTIKRRYYTYDFKNEDHVRLCELINNSKAYIILSGYENEIYNTHLKAFRKTSLFSYDEKGNKRIEVIWTNYKSTINLFDQFEEAAS